MGLLVCGGGVGASGCFTSAGVGGAMFTVEELLPPNQSGVSFFLFSGSELKSPRTSVIPVPELLRPLRGPSVGSRIVLIAGGGCSLAALLSFKISSKDGVFV